MIIGTVKSAIHAARTAESLNVQSFLVVDTPTGEVAAANLADAKPSDRVLLVTGPVASRFCVEAPVDAAVVAVLENGNVSR